MNHSALSALFSDFFHAPAQLIARAPGRVNLIGEHTDYNDGLVLPIAIDRAIYIAARARNDRVVRMIARDFGDARAEFSLDQIARDDEHTWSNYIRGVAWALHARGENLRGADLLIQGDVPIGAGLSSSAALEMCAAIALMVGAGRASAQIDRVDLARLCQHAENNFVGVQSGVMDQCASALAHKNHALYLDCRDLSFEHIPLPTHTNIVVCDTMKRRALTHSAYNARRAECENAVRILRDKLGARVRALRDVSAQDFSRYENEMPPILSQRARHVISENERVREVVRAARANDAKTFGRVMNESHASLRDDFAVSCAALDIMVELARKQAGCYGARLTGAGFGGCTVNLVEANQTRAFVENIAREYAARVGIAPEIYVCRASDGAEIIQTGSLIRRGVHEKHESTRKL
ncbi:MAG: galactokinase [Chloroflexi bacterium]|nr:galactokinase [Chloroflexota bacterium]